MCPDLYSSSSCLIHSVHPGGARFSGLTCSRVPLSVSCLRHHLALWSIAFRAFSGVGQDSDEAARGDMCRPSKVGPMPHRPAYCSILCKLAFPDRPPLETVKDNSLAGRGHSVTAPVEKRESRGILSSRRMGNSLEAPAQNHRRPKGGIKLRVLAMGEKAVAYIPIYRHHMATAEGCRSSLPRNVDDPVKPISLYQAHQVHIPVRAF